MTCFVFSFILKYIVMWLPGCFYVVAKMMSVDLIHFYEVAEVLWGVSRAWLNC